MLISGALAAVVAVMLTVQTPLVTPDFALRDTIIVLAGVVLGGMNRPIPATLGGFAIGFASGLLGGALPTDQSQYLPTFLFAAVILVLLVRPARPLRARHGGGARMRRLVELQQLLAPAVLVIAAALARHARLELDADVLHRRARQGRDRRRALRLHRQLRRALVRPHQLRRARRLDGRRALGAAQREAGDHAEPRALSSRDRTTGNLTSLVLAALVGGVCAFVVGVPLMRLSGLAAGIATFAVLEITHNLLRYQEKIGPGLNTFSSVPETTGLRQAALGALLAVVVAYAYARSRFGRLLRATREDSAAARAVGASVYRQRLVAFTLSGLLAGLAGGLYVHLLPLNTEAVYLDLTFITLAMLVIGGATSLWGAVVGALAVSALDSYLADRRERHDALRPARSTCPPARA